MRNGRWLTQTGPLTYLNEAKAIWLRDLRGEFRTRYAVNSILMFAVTTLVAVSFSIGSFRIGDAEKPFLYSVLLWIILVFSALSGLSRSFVKEEDGSSWFSPLCPVFLAPLSKRKRQGPLMYSSSLPAPKRYFWANCFST